MQVRKSVSEVRGSKTKEFLVWVKGASFLSRIFNLTCCRIVDVVVVLVPLLLDAVGEDGQEVDEHHEHEDHDEDVLGEHQLGAAQTADRQTNNHQAGQLQKRERKESQRLVIKRK